MRSSSCRCFEATPISIWFHNQMLPGELTKQWKQWVITHVPVIEFSIGKYDLGMVKKCFVKGISFSQGYDCNGCVFATKKENNYTFLTTSKCKFLYVKNYIGTGWVVMLSASQWFVNSKSWYYLMNSPRTTES